MKISESRLRQIIREELTSGEGGEPLRARFDIPYDWLSAKGYLDLGVEQDVTDLFEGDLEAPLSAKVVDPDGGQKIVGEPPGPVVEFEFRDGTHGYSWALSAGIVRDRNEFYRGVTRPFAPARGANEPDTGRY